MRTFAEERQQRVLAELQQRGRVEVSTLARELAVSEDTVRRDLRALAAAGHLHKTHGGAVALDTGHLSWAARADVASDAKRAIAAAAVELVEPGDTVILDAGSTVLALAVALAGSSSHRPLTVLTNSLDIAEVFTGTPDVTLHLTGGQWDARSRFLVGPAATAGIAAYRADWAFLGTCALHPDAGATSVDPLDADVKRAMAAVALRVAVLADHTKHGTTAPHLVLSPDDLDVLVTDVAQAGQDWLDRATTVHVVRA
ncbi:DeoR/GlpR family DNA-binding transcription regulator [Nocardioides lijunqiniae]|uniref:DeoR/GlpR family DNA-binding transcription regulator n=1 Tax=Nocardioides lijunqiniae TaxID=2760832 RepID=UPI0018778AB2|nr:DeoR/GlpR family DNA-binding transcription regulator [Nocardioides lijunqiniae]